MAGRLGRPKRLHAFDVASCTSHRGGDLRRRCIAGKCVYSGWRVSVDGAQRRPQSRTFEASNNMLKLQVTCARLRSPIPPSNFL